MGHATGLSPAQRAALAGLSPLANDFGLHLVGGSAIAVHLEHRRSVDLDLFSIRPTVDIEQVRRRIVDELPKAKIVEIGDSTMRARLGRIPIDIVSYPYLPLVKPRVRQEGVAIAGLADLAAMKLAAIARRGIRRDFWDIHAIVTSGRLDLRAALRSYLRKFGTAEPDIYPVLRSLVYFEDADAESVMPAGLSATHWERIKVDLRRLAPRLLAPLRR